ncbi:MAG: anti-sigma factor [Bacteroidota bacterium]
MDSKAYIESGILETYALGMCSDEEAHQVEAMCSQYPEVKAELTEIQDAINGYATAHGKAPKASTRDFVLNEIAALEESVQYAKPTIPLFNSRLAVAASLILLSLSLIGNIFFYNRWRSANNEVIALNTEKQQLAANFKSNQVKLETMNNDMAVITNPYTMKVMMKGVEKSPNSMAMIYWNKQSKEVFIELKSLPIPEQGKQYQLWAIVDGKPVDAGMITMKEGDSSLHKMRDFESAQAFAITLEKEGGNPSPTLTEMYVMGAVGS